MEDNFIMGRVETLDKKKNIQDTKHNHRLVYTKRKVNNLDNYIIKNENIFKLNNENKSKIINNSEYILKENSKEHSRLFKQTKGYRKNGTQTSTYTGIVAFTQFNEDTKNTKELILQVEKNLNSFCQKVGSELQELILHRDERQLDKNHKDYKIGQYHFHFKMKAYDKNGMSLKMGKGGINGSLLQDYLAQDMEQFGIKRGIKNSKKRHLTIEDYKEQQDRLKEIEETKIKLNNILEKNNNLEIENEELKQDIRQLTREREVKLKHIEENEEIIQEQEQTIREQSKLFKQQEELISTLTQQQQELITNIQDTIKNIIEVDKKGLYKDKLKTFVELFTKTISKEELEKLEKLYKRATKLEKSTKKTYRTM
jgi:hypothetical protein